MPLLPPSHDRSERPQPRRRQSPGATLKALGEGTPFARRQAALDLVGATEATGALIARLGLEPEASVRAGILDALISIGSEEVVQALIATLRAEDAGRRNEAVTALQQLPLATATHMAALLRDPDPDVRIMAVDVLRLLPHADAPGWLAELLDRETHVNVTGAAIDRLAEIGDPRHLPALRLARDRFAAEPYIVFAADLVIRRVETMAAEDET